MNELISIIVPVYNVEKYLERCVNSIINQTYKNIEIILVNDGSTDNSGNICEELAKNDLRIKVLYQNNFGQSAARNRALDMAKGDYIGFVDSDDWISLDMYEYMHKIMQERNVDIVDVGCFQTADYNTVAIDKSDEVSVYVEKDMLWHYMYRGITEQNSAPYSACRKLYKRALWESIKFPHGKINEEIVTNYNILKKANDIAVCKCIKYFYYNNYEGTTGSAFKHKDLSLLDICQELCAVTYNEGYKDIHKLAKVKLARSYFSLLAKVAVNGSNVDDDKLDNITKTLTGKLRNKFLLLIRSPIPINRKIMIGVVCIDWRILRLMRNAYMLLKK